MVALLSPEERKRLKERNYESMDSQTRASNDSRVRRKLRKWFKEDLNDVSLALNQLSQDRLKLVLTDGDVFRLLDAALQIARIKEFAPLIGKIEDPSSWKVGDRQAEDNDIQRAAKLHWYIEKLNEFSDQNNLIAKAELFWKMETEGMGNRISEAERHGADEIAIALSKKSL